MPLRRSLLTLAVATAFACVTDTKIGPDSITALTVVPDTLSLPVGSSRQLILVARDSKGIPYVGVDAVWSSSNDMVATVTEAGRVAGAALGMATITATAGGLTASAQIVTVPPPLIVLATHTANFNAIANGPAPATQTIAISNGGGAALTGLVIDTVTYGAGASGWLNATLAPASAPATLTLDAVTTGLALGTYTAKVAIISPVATNSPDSVNVTITVGADVATQIALNAGDGQTATVNTTVATAPSVLVQDQYGNPVGGVAVTFAAASGGGSVTGGSATTTAAGVATVGSWTLGTATGANTLTADAPGLTGTPITFAATAVAAAASQMALLSGDGQTATVGSAVAAAPTVVVQDAFGNPVQGVTVTFAVAAGGGSLTSATPVSDLNGYAAVGSWTLGTTAGPNSLTATAGGLTGSPVTFTATGTPAAASQLTASAGDGQSAAVGTAVAIAPAVLVRDAFNNPVAGVEVTFAVASGGGSLTGGVDTSDAAGLAAVGSWTLGNTTGANTLTATAPGLTGSPVTFTATATAGAATQMTLSAGNGQTATVNTALPVLPAVLVRDAFNNPVAGVSVTFAVTAGGGGLTGGNATTDPNGIATVGSWTLGTAAGANTLTATSAGLAGSPVTFGATGTADAATQIALAAGNGQTATVNSAVAVAPAVVVRDQFNNPVPGVTVTFAVQSGGGGVLGAAPATNASGIATVGSWTLGTAAGVNNNSLTATVAGLAGSPVTFTATAAAGAATQIALNGGDAQTAAVTTTVPIAPSVLVRDAFNNPVQSVPVTFAVTGGGGSVAGGNATTGSNGIAQVTSWTMGTAAGANTLTATAAGLTGSPVTFTATAFAGSATTIALNGGNAQTDTAGATLGVAYSVLVTDAVGNPVQGIPVGWAVTGGGGSILPATSNTDVNGIATATRTLGTTAGTNTATAAVGGLAGSPVTFSATATAATATQIALNAGDAQSATVNTAVAVNPSVIVRDQFNNPKSGVSVTFAIGAGGGGVTGATPSTNASGVATVGSWTLGTAAGANTLTATAGGLTGSPVTFSATGTAGTATQIALNAGNNQTATVNTTVATAPAVLVRDQFNNPVAGVGVTFAVTGGGGSMTGSTPTTGVNGIATLGSWKLGTTAGTNNNTLTATVAGLTGSPVGFTASAAHDVASQIAVNAGNNQSAQVNSAVPIAPSVVVSDQFGNAVPGISVTFAVTGGGGTVNPTTALTTDASGIAQVTSWTLGPIVGTNTLSATSSPALTGSPLTITATSFSGTATTMALSAGDNQTDTVGATLAVAYAVLVTDGTNPVPGVPVSWAATGGGGSITPASSNTDVNGIATATRTLGTTAGAQTATASVGGLIGSPVTFTATATPGAATQIAANAGNGQSATAGTAVGTAPSVIVRDQFGNPKPGIGVTFAVGSGGGGLTGATPTTDASGIATVGSWTLGTTAGTNTLTATSGGLTGSPVTFTATGTADAATQIALNAGNNQTATVNTAVAVDPAVLVRDQFNNPVPGVTVIFAVTAGAGSVVGDTATTDASGIATVGAWTLGTAAGTGNNTLTASATGLAGSPVTFTASATPGAPQTIALSAGDGQSATVNTAVAVNPAVLVTDPFGNPVTGVSVTFAVQNGGGGITGVSPTTNTSGIATVGSWTLGTLAGTSNNTLTASAAVPVGSPVTFTATATAGAATQMALNAGDNQTATVNTNVATAPAVLVRDQFNNPVPGVTVTFAVVTGSGSLTGSSPATDGTGIATLGTWTLGTVAGTNNNTLRATAAGLADTVVFTASASPDAPATLAVNAGDGQTATVNTAVGVNPAVLVTDQFGNAVPGINVTFTPSGGSVTGSPATSDAGGVATVTSWTLAQTAGSNTLQASYLALTPATFTATGTADAAATIAVNGGDGQSATVNTNVVTAPSVVVTDQFGNPVSGVDVTFAVTSGGGTVNPTTQLTTDALGIAQVTSWTLGQTAGGNTLSATSSLSLAGNPVTFTATGTAGAATQMSLNAGNGQSATVNTAVTTDPQVLVRDQFNNPVQSAPITFTITGGGGTLNPVSGSTVFSDVNGLATVTSWTLGTAAGTNTLQAVNGGLSGSPITFTATGTPGAVSASVSTVVDGAATITACSVSCTVAGATADSVTITAMDQFGNTIGSLPVTVTVTGSSNTVSPSASGTTNGAGVYAVKLSSTLAQAKTISATINAVSITQTAAVTVNPDVASLTNSLLTRGTASITACSAGCVAGSTASTITATIRDQFSNPITGAIVTFSSSGSSNTFTTSATDTTVAGVASRNFNSTVAQAKTISAFVSGVGTLTTTVSVTVVAGAPASVTVFSGNSQTARVGFGVATRPTWDVNDAFGNAVTSQAVTITSSGGGTPSPTSGFTNGSGQFTLTSWTLGGTGTETGTGGLLNDATLTAGSFSATARDTAFYTYSGDVGPIIGDGAIYATSNCSGCHYNQWTRANIVNVVDSDPVGYTSCSGWFLVQAGVANNSLIYRKTAGTQVGGTPPCGSTMPSASGLSAAQRTIIRTWINRNALNN